MAAAITARKNEIKMLILGHNGESGKNGHTPNQTNNANCGNHGERTICGNWLSKKEMPAKHKEIKQFFYVFFISIFSYPNPRHF
ncbi:MAG: hypothetical protein FWG10_13230 [Eubacteriaceae bacterium]|nr:hypothetical protein [Eubacteriaceae bacterium]